MRVHGEFIGSTATYDEPLAHRIGSGCRPWGHRVAAGGGDGPADDPRFEALLGWKHAANPFGASPAWVAMEGDEVLGYRAFMRWEFTDGRRTYHAGRAVDTATHPDHQGKGIFRTLTMHGLDELRAEGVDFIFNTPNDNSRPGYLRMGWELVGTLRPGMRPRSPATIPAIARGRVPAGHWGPMRRRADGGRRLRRRRRGRRPARRRRRRQ